VLVFLAALVAVLATLLSSASASAATTAVAETRVRASAVVVDVLVELTVAGIHTYHVGEQQILVHNVCSLEARAKAVHSVLDPIAQRSRTTAALSTREGQTVLASGGRDLSPA
jgi:hypothetical protein